MWIDNASSVDMLSYRPYAKLIHNIINNKRMNPLTIGLFGSWGVGKSTLLKLIENEIESNPKANKKIVSVTLNAWMFEGYDEAKTALMESLLKAIEATKNFPVECKEEIGKLIKRIDYFRLAGTAIKKGVPLALSVASGNPAPLLLNCTKGVLDNLKTENGMDNFVNIANKFKENFVKEEKTTDIIENIRIFKVEFEKLLQALKIDNLVVMIDDLDRCTPERIIDTLEAIKLFLSVQGTTFIIAVDERIVTYAIKKKYPVIDDDTTDISKDYIEKIIQLPIKLPELSPIDIQNYMLLLVYELYLEDEFRLILDELYQEGVFITGEALKGEVIDSKIINQGENISELKELSKVVQQIGGVVSRALKGNPRQAKRFLNTFLVRKQMAEVCFTNGENIQNSILAKLMALEYVDIELFKELNKWYKKSSGEIEELKEMVDKVKREEDLIDKYSKWNDDKVKNWILCEPQDIYKKNLDRYFYLTRDVLVEESNTLDLLSGQEKEMIYQLMEVEDDIASQKVLINKIVALDDEVMSKMIKSVLGLYDRKKIKLNLLISIFERCEKYRSDVLERISKMKKEDIKPLTYGQIATLYRLEPQQTKEVLRTLASKGVLTEAALLEKNIDIKK